MWINKTKEFETFGEALKTRLMSKNTIASNIADGTMPFYANLLTYTILYYTVASKMIKQGELLFQ